MLLNADKEIAKVFSQYDKDKVVWIGTNNFSSPPLFPNLSPCSSKGGRKGRRNASTECTELEATAVRAKATTAITGESGNGSARKGRRAPSMGWNEYPLQEDKKKRTSRFWALVCDDRGRHKFDIDCRWTEIHEQSMMHTHYLSKSQPGSKRHVLHPCNVFYFFPRSHSALWEGRISTLKSFSFFFFFFFKLISSVDRQWKSFLLSQPGHKICIDLTLLEKEPVKHLARTQCQLTKEKLRADKIKPHMSSFQVAAWGKKLLLQTMGGRLPPARFALTASRLGRWSRAAQLVGSSPKSMAKKLWTGVNNPSATPHQFPQLVTDSR